MTFFGIHFCHEELFAIMAMVPFLSVGISRARGWLHRRKECECLTKEEKDE